MTQPEGAFVANLIAKKSCSDALPFVCSGCSLEQITPNAITSISVGSGQLRNVSNRLKSISGVAFPAPNRATGKDGARCVWFGPSQAFFVGSTPEITGAVLTDQSDGWVILRLEGKQAEAVLARLVPVDFSAASFKRGHTARTMLFHMATSITRVKANAFDIMVFRSMAKTAIEELSHVMKSIEARQPQE